MHIYGFEKLDVWQRSRKLVKEIYILTKNFPESEKFGLVTQLRRAAVSVSNNLVEGNARLSKKDKAYFLQMSFSSLMEVLNMLILAVDLQLLDEQKYENIRPLIEEISNKINALRKSTLS